jgi:hypothetical protein
MGQLSTTSGAGTEKKGLNGEYRRGAQADNGVMQETCMAKPLRKVCPTLLAINQERGNRYGQHGKGEELA